MDITDPNEPAQLVVLQSIVRVYWSGKAVRKALKKVQHSHENVTFLRSNEWIQHWIDEADRVLAPEYVPTADDLLKLRRPTSGEQVLRFRMRGQPFELVDLGGQTHEMKTWAYHMEQNLSGIVFMLSLADFDIGSFVDYGTRFYDKHVPGTRRVTGEAAGKRNGKGKKGYRAGKARR